LHLILVYRLLLLNNSDDFDGFASFGAFDQLVHEYLLVALLHSKVLDRMLEHIERMSKVAKIVQIEREVLLRLVCDFCVGYVFVVVCHN